jgi:low temperature requirement protein LtrA
MKSNFNPLSPFLTLDDQPVSFAELFFDLVFVYAITQVVHLMNSGFDWIHVVGAILVFWLVWWAWTQYSWALNAANTNHRAIQVTILVATAIAFFMAVSVPQAFGPSSKWFALAYVAVRGIGLLIYIWVTWPDPTMRKAVRTFSVLSITGLCSALAGGFLSGNLQYILWGLTILLDLIAAGIGGNREGWNLHPKHFSERHGLFVIIALGETLIISASAATEEFSNIYLLAVSSISVGITCCLWWIYFFRAKEKLEHAMESKTGVDRSRFGRDAYSLFHFPLICGLIIYAYAIEEAMSHPHAELSLAARTALALGICIYSIGLVATHWRATGKILFSRLSISVVTAGCIYFISGVQTYWTLLIAFTGLVVLCVAEELFSPFENEMEEGIEID